MADIIGPPIWRRRFCPSRRRGFCLAAALAAGTMLIVFSAPPALGVSPETRDGMAAYNAGDLTTAFRLLSEAAAAGDPEAQVNLGYFYARGQVVPPDQHEAFRLYALAAAQGNSEDMNALGYKYQFATGVPRNIPKAVYWYCQAIALGNPRAMNNLARLLDIGADLPRDIAEARSLWRQSAALGHANAMFNLGMSYARGAPDSRNRQLAWRWLLAAGLAGQPDAQMVLRRNGYTGSLPAPHDQAGGMIPTPRNAAGHTKVCGGIPIS